MAKVSTNVQENVYQIKHWKGVNEAQEGEASLEMGEAAIMRNFKVTAGGALQKRGGTKNIAGLLGSYTVEADVNCTFALFGADRSSVMLYPGVSVNDMGMISVSGTPVLANPANAEVYEGWYYTDETGNCYRFEEFSAPQTNVESESEVEATWYFSPLRAVSSYGDVPVRGLWSGYVNGEEVLCAACNGYLWKLTQGSGGTWSKTSCGSIDTSRDVCMFGFDENLYLLNGSQYRVWDGESLTDVAGYRPLVAVSAPPEGGGTSLEQVNKLCGQRRMRFSPDGSATTFHLPEREVQSIDYVRYVASGVDLTVYQTDLEDGTVTITPAPAEGTNSLEVGWTVGANSAAEVRAMRFAELYNGEQDTRVFIYGDGSNRALYTGVDFDGLPRADYFPDLNVAHVGDANTPITAMIRHYDRLLAFKLDSAWSIGYSQITLADGSITAGFYISPINKTVGNCAPGQAVLVENRPRTLDGRSVIEWKSTSSSGNINGDERNAERVSKKVERSIAGIDLASSKAFYDKYSHEYYVAYSDGVVLVNGIDSEAWYIYTNIFARCFVNYKDELFFGTPDGFIRRLSDEYLSDNGYPIDAYWESGSMPFSADFQRKYSAMLWVGIRPDDHGRLMVTAETDRKSDFAEYVFSTDNSAAMPEMNRLKLKAKKFTYYKLILQNNTADTTATVVSVDIRVRGTGYVR